MAACGYLRASHGDREQVIAVLKAAFVQGMLTKDELDARAGQTFASRTRGDLAVLTADLPAGLARTQPVRKPVRAKAEPSAKVAVILCPGFFASAGAGTLSSPYFALVVGLIPVLITVPWWPGS